MFQQHANFVAMFNTGLISNVQSVCDSQNNLDGKNRIVEACPSSQNAEKSLLHSPVLTGNY